MGSPHFTLLVEDRAHELFVYRALETWGVRKQRIYVPPYPRGEGSGEQFVRDSFADFVNDVRRATSSKFLIVVTDADSLTVVDRRAQLIGKLAALELPSLSADEPVVLLVPKRAIETWLAHVVSPMADEATDYHHRFDGPRTAVACKEASKMLEGLINSTASLGLPSLDAARPDLLRIRSAAKS